MEILIAEAAYIFNFTNLEKKSDMRLDFALKMILGKTNEVSSSMNFSIVVHWMGREFLQHFYVSVINLSTHKPHF